MIYKRYRIVKDTYLGHEVQVMRNWLPFWFQCHNTGSTNTFETLKQAKEFIKDKKKKKISKVIWSEEWD